MKRKIAGTVKAFRRAGDEAWLKEVPDTGAQSVGTFSWVSGTLEKGPDDVSRETCGRCSTSLPSFRIERLPKGCE